jgi:aspartate carbamoyltransferase regulatory subunit
MLNIDTIKNGLVVDHIRAGLGPQIFFWLGLNRAHYCAALIMNVPSKRFGLKDIIKIDNIIDIDYSVLGLIDPNITVNVVKNEAIARKIRLSLPERVGNVIRCKNPRCITSSETNIAHIFCLTDKKNAEYRCEYCDSLYRAGTGEGL